MNIELSCRWGRPGITGRAKGIFMRQSWIYRCKDHFAVFPRFRLEFSRSQPFPKWSCIKTAPTLRGAKTTTSVGYSPERPQDAGRSFPLGQKGRSEQYCRGLRSHVEGRRSEGFPRQFHDIATADRHGSGSPGKSILWRFTLSEGSHLPPPLQGEWRHEKSGVIDFK